VHTSHGTDFVDMRETHRASVRSKKHSGIQPTVFTLHVALHTCHVIHAPVAHSALCRPITKEEQSSFEPQILVCTGEWYLERQCIPVINDNKGGIERRFKRLWTTNNSAITLNPCARRPTEKRAAEYTCPSRHERRTRFRQGNSAWHCADLPCSRQ